MWEARRLILEDGPELETCARRAREWGVQRMLWCALRLVEICFPSPARRKIDGSTGSGREKANGGLFAPSVWRRAFEPPAVSAAESAGVLRTLADLYLATGDAALLKPIPAAVAWYRRSQIGPNRWARLYELETNTPIYGDRDGRIHYRLSEISAERRSGYAWEGGFGIPETLQYVEGILRDAATKPASKAGETEPAVSPAPSDQDGPGAKVAARSAAASAAANPTAIAGILAAQEASGRWLTRGRIEMRTFIRNIHALCDYLAGVSH